MKYRIGICAGPNQIAAAARAGFDYMELDLNTVLNMDIPTYQRMAAEMEKNGMYARVTYGMLPADKPIVGAHVSAQDIRAALDRSFETAAALGAEILVMDCGPARRLPSGFDPALAWRQLGNLIRMVQEYAAHSGVRGAILPLCRREADLLNHVSEAAMITAMLRLENVGVAASGYHMAMEAESMQALRRTGSLLWHVRTSNALGNRLPRRGDGQDYGELLGTLSDMGYGGCVSCEGACDIFERDAAEACACLKEACAAQNL